MTYTLTDNGEVILQMSLDQYSQLLAFLARAAGEMVDHSGLSIAIEFMNAMNRTNPEWTPLDVPARHA